MKRNILQLLKPVFALLISSVMLYSCSATVKIPKHPAPGEPPTAPKVEINKDK